MEYRYFNMLIFITLLSAACFSDGNDNIPIEECSDRSAAMNKSNFRNTNMQIPHQIHTISFAGAGIGHVNSAAFKKISVDFFISHLWEVFNRCAVGIGGEYTTDINDASLASVTGVINVYPFRYGITPYLGIEAGGGYAQIPGKTDFGIALSAETGVLAIKVSNLLIGVSARLTYFTIRVSEERPFVVLIRVGILL